MIVVEARPMERINVWWSDRVMAFSKCIMHGCIGRDCCLYSVICQVGFSVAFAAEHDFLIQIS